MKIAYISQPFDYIAHNFQSSSIGIWTDRAAQGLIGKGANPILYAKKFSNQPPVEQHGAVQYLRFSTLADEWAAKPPKLVERLLNYPVKRRPFFASFANYLVWGLNVARDISRRKPDIVHIQNYSQFIPLIRQYNPHVKIVLHMHCEWLTQIHPSVILPRLEQVDLIAGCSDYITNTIKQAFPRLADRCQPIYNGVDAQLFAPPRAKAEDSCKRILFVGRVSPEKGLHVLLQAFQIVASKVPDAQLEIVGAPGDAPYEYIVLVSQDPKVRALKTYYHGISRSGAYYTELQGLIPASLASRVRFSGYVAHADLVKYYQSADVLVNPSFSESFGMSLIEAMACQVPVVATRAGGMVEIVAHGKTGLSVETDNPEALASALVEALNSADDLARMGAAGRQRVEERYTWGRVTGTLWNQYRQLLRAR